ncbi:accessory gene regulator B family protein [Ruminococcus sp. Marseille-P6503]|uniref:accessory gene regulator B family protein n=1 Tax=Ruminococcus sp. Marseille-P6503 TaxID=2364796 RepID=UPI0013DE16D3|nr:accessory gene regulator B family protein [Ruminococcus sp. Marseille-P6503]
MFEKLSNSIVKWLIKNNILKECDYELYSYCMTGLIEMGFNIIITIIIGLIWSKVIESVIFLFIMIPLRSIAGGFHAESGAVCFVISILIYITAIFISSILKLENSITAIIFVILLISVGSLTPVDSWHKKLDKKQKLKQRLSYVKLSAFIILIFLILMLLNCKRLCVLIDFIFLTVMILQLLGSAKNKIIEKNYR